MTTISSTSILQQLMQKDSSTSNGSTSTAQSTLTDYLAQAQGKDIGNASSSSGNSYLLDLSAEAQAYLTSGNGSGGGSQGSSTSSTGASIVLSPVEQDKLTAILQKYKNAPYTEATFQNIQKDMSAAGIGADSLAAKAEMRNLNPSAMLLNALNGGDGSVGTVGNSTDIASMETSFMGKVNSQWQAISSDYDSTTGGAKSQPSSDDTTAGGTSVDA